MNAKLKRSAVVTLVLGLIALSTVGSFYVPVFAQEGAGDQILGLVQPLSSSGEGDNTVLTSNMLTIAPGERHAYRFDYDGGDQPIRVSLNSIPAGSVQFQIWTDDLVTALNDDPELGPLGVGEPISNGSEFAVWQGNTPNAEVYYITVESTVDRDAQYQLTITSPGLSENQPGVVQPTPVPPTATPVPPATATPLPPGPTATGTRLPPGPTATANVIVVPASPPDPTIAVVTAAALNVRSGPSTSYPVITTVPAGTILTVLGRNASNTWLAVRLDDGTEGWVTRTLTDYVTLATIILTPEPLPTPTPLPGVTATPTPNTTIIVVEAPVPEALDGDWKVISEGETHWYTFQYRGGGLPVHVWMDVEPDKGAVFNILSQETAQAILAGVAPTVVNAVGRGTANPVEPGYLFWRSDFPEADLFYVMVQHEGPGDVVYSIHAAGPGLSRPVPQ